jgi:hypothetical protein
MLLYEQGLQRYFCKLLLVCASCSVHDVEKKYYADGEDAYCMRKLFKSLPENGKTRDRRLAGL